MPIETLTADELDGARHAFFTRKGGVSTSVWTSLNCGRGSDDDADKVAENRAIAAEHMGVLPDRLIGPHQIHSPLAEYVADPFAPGDAPKADALVTDQPGIALSVLTADCAPILMVEPNARIIAAVHAGWRGALSGVIEATVDLMEEKGADRDEIAAGIGPCISQRAYEVGPEFMAEFTADDGENAQFFAAGPRGKPVFNLPAYCLHRLRKAQVFDCGWVGRCTYDDRDRFYSYRRATHRDEKDYGRQISAIVIPRYG